MQSENSIRLVKLEKYHKRILDMNECKDIFLNNKRISN